MATEKPLDDQPENELTGEELQRLLFFMGQLKSNMEVVKELLGNQDLVTRLRKMYNSDDGGSGTSLDMFLNNVTGNQDYVEDFEDFLKSVNRSEATLQELFAGTYNGHGIVGGDHRPRRK